MYMYVLYDQTATTDSVNNRMQELYAEDKQLEMMQKFLPTQYSVIQHASQSIYLYFNWLTSLQ